MKGRRSPLARLEAYLDGAPVRRRLRMAVAIVAATALAYLWVPAAAQAIGQLHYHEYSQGFLDDEYQKCQTGTLGFYDNLDQEVGTSGSCHSADAAALNESKRTVAYGAALGELQKPMFHTVLLLLAVCAIWILIPLVDRSNIQ